MASIRILLAEDNQDHQELLSRALVKGRPDVQVSVVSDRDGLLAALARERFDCLVLDFNLPPFRAVDIIEQIRDTLERTPAVIISSCLEQQVVIETMRTGVADFVPKHEALTGDMLWCRVLTSVERTRKQRTAERHAERRLCSLRHHADHDALTGLYNRGYGDRLLCSKRLHKDRRKEAARILIDLDHFKNVNDTRGHKCGDFVLREVAGLIQKHAAACDTVIRWGGEEFLVVKSSCSMAVAWSWADDLRCAIAEHEMVFEGVPLHVTASVGAVSLATDVLCPDSVCLADRALYLAKELGRNRVCTWSMVQVYEAAEDVVSDAANSWLHVTTSLIRSLAWIGSTQAEQTGPHCELVRELVVRIGRTLGLSTQQSHDLEVAAMLHDIGKITIPEELLAKPGPLTRAEKKFVDEHARFGADLCRALGMSEPVVQAVARHHARFDEPRRDGTEDAPTIARIIGAADAYVTMTHDRPYARRRSVEQALAELDAERGRQFDPDIVNAFSVSGQPLLSAIAA